MSSRKSKVLNVPLLLKSSDQCFLAVRYKFASKVNAALGVGTDTRDIAGRLGIQGVR